MKNATTNRAIDMSEFKIADDSINWGIERHDFPGAVLVVGTHDRIIYRKAYGNRAVEPKKLPMKIDTVFDLASLTKNIATTICVMQLVEQGKIDVHAPVAKYIPEFAANGKGDITIQDLLLHHSGLEPDNSLKDYEDGPAEAWKRIFALKPMAPPDKKFVYSDLNFEVLGQVVQRVSGETLDKYAMEHVFKPLGMDDTMYNPPPAIRKRCAYTGFRNGHWMVGEVHDPRAYLLGGVAGHAGVFSTGDDVAKWCQMMLNDGELNGHRVLKKSTVLDMIKLRTLPDGSGGRGYGVDIETAYSPSVRGRRFERGTTYGHTGYTGTSYWIDPVHDCFVVLLTNRVHPSDALGRVARVRREVDTAAACAFLGPIPPTPPASEANEASGYRPRGVLTGIDVLERDNFRELSGRKVGLITNQTGVSRGDESTFAELYFSGACKVVKLFSPEHGFYGIMDQKVGNAVEPHTGVPIFSLYGKTTKPTDQMLQGVDTLVYDIQDVGARFYTFESTLGLCMEAAAKNHIKFVVLDRPNPITGKIVEGPIADKDSLGFTAFGPEPVAQGMTVGELAQLFNDAFNIHCDLTVIKMQGWHRDMWYDQTGLLWINPSPNMRNLTQALLYPGICLLEPTNMSVGRGTDQPFEQFGAPWVDARELARSLNRADIPGLRFVPINFTPAKGAKLGGELCGGVYIIVTDRNALRPVDAGVTIVWTLHKLYGDQFDINRVDHLLRNKQALQAILSAKDPAKIPLVWQQSLEQFKALRAKYLIYR